MTAIFLDILDPKRKEVFGELKALAKKGTLAGGTTLALQLKHRYSLDFDIFFGKRIVRQAFKSSLELKKKGLIAPITLLS